MSTKPKTPCYECEERQAGCHAKCEKYASWKTEYNAKSDSERAMRAMFLYDARQQILPSSTKNKIRRERKK